MSDIKSKPITVFCFWLFLFVSISGSLKAQVVFQHIANTSIYDFLEEMAALQLIEINSIVKPYSRSFIANQLNTIDQNHRSELNARQNGELSFFLKDYGKELFGSKSDFDKRLDAFYYKDSMFTVSLNPILNADYNLSAGIFNRKYGVNAFSYLGENWGAYFDFKDNYENESLTNPNFLNQRIGGDLRFLNDGGAEFAEMRGGLTYSWDWGHVGLVQEYIQWGNNYNGATILSGRTPLYPQFILKVKPTNWLELNAVHARLNTDIVDSTRTYPIPGNNRIVYREKYFSANLVTISPINRLDISIGNSTVYSDIGFHPAYLIPFFFHRPIDHAVSGNHNNAGQNSQLFIDVSSRNINHLHLYGSIFIDELKLNTLFDEEERRDQVTYKVGAKLFNLPSNFSTTLEYTLSRPAAYRHYIPVLEYQSSDYLLGHYLGENSDELFLELAYRPIPRFFSAVAYLKQRKGNSTILDGRNSATALPFLEIIEYEHQAFSAQVRYEWKNDIWLGIEIIRSKTEDITESYTPDWQRGTQTFFKFKGGIGF